MAKKDATKRRHPRARPRPPIRASRPLPESQGPARVRVAREVEAGLVLTGTEVKSLRNGKANLEDAYAEVDGRDLAARV